MAAHERCQQRGRHFFKGGVQAVGSRLVQRGVGKRTCWHWRPYKSWFVWSACGIDKKHGEPQVEEDQKGEALHFSGDDRGRHTRGNSP